MPIALRTLPLSLIGLLALVIAACRPSPTPEPTSTEAPYVMTATIKDLMLSIIDPNADVVWESVSMVSNEQGVTETVPKTDEDWARVRHGAMTLAEASNLLMMPGRRVARPGEKSETPGVELEPEEMDVLIAKDRASWNKRAAALRLAALDILKAVDAKDPAKVFEIGEHIELACEGCHSQYWYPGEVVPQSVILAPEPVKK